MSSITTRSGTKRKLEAEYEIIKRQCRIDPHSFTKLPSAVLLNLFEQLDLPVLCSLRVAFLGDRKGCKLLLEWLDNNDVWRAVARRAGLIPLWGVGEGVVRRETVAALRMVNLFSPQSKTVDEFRHNREWLTLWGESRVIKKIANQMYQLYPRFPQSLFKRSLEGEKLTRDRWRDWMIDHQESPIVDHCLCINEMIYELPELPEWVAPAIRHIQLGSNRFSAIPPALLKMPQLECLNLANGSIKNLDIPEVNFPELRVVCLSANPLNRLPEWLKLLPKLEYLCVTGLKLTKKSKQLLQELEQGGCRVNRQICEPACFDHIFA